MKRSFEIFEKSPARHGHFRKIGKGTIGAVLMLTLVFAACFEPREGCLDIEATNFDATADKDCCCEYPKLILEVAQNFTDSLVFVPGKDYELAPGHWMSIETAVFYLSDFQLVQNGETFVVADTVRLKTLPDSVEIKFTDDFQVIRRTPGEYEIGEFRQSGTFAEASIGIGLSSIANTVAPSRAPSGHPLRPQAEGLWTAGRGYDFVKIVFSRDTAANIVPDTIAIGPPDFAQKTLAFPGVFNHESGFDFRLKMTVDFRRWFDGVDLSADDNLTIKAKIIANLPGSFSVSQ